MKIVNVEAFGLRVPPAGTYCEWGWAASLIKITTDEGIVGWGESDTNPELFRTLVNMNNSNGCSYGLKEILMGENPLDVGRLWNKMFFYTNHHGRVGAAIHAISAADMALWDIAGKYYNVPVYQLLGGKYRDSIRSYGTIVPYDEHEKTAETAKKAVAQCGYSLIKISGGKFGTSEKFDVDCIRAVREAVGDDVEVAIDPVKLWEDAGTAITRIKKLEKYNLAFVEEPVKANDYVGYHRISEKVTAKISGGEALTSLSEFDEFMTYGTPDIVQPDLSNCGGISEGKKIELFATQRGMKLIPHGYSTGILVAAIVHFLASSPTNDLMEYPVCDSPLFTDLDRNLLMSENGCVQVPNRPGLGVDIDESVIEKYLLK